MLAVNSQLFLHIFSFSLGKSYQIGLLFRVELRLKL